jgi:flagellar hook assembly protein FlgD
VKAGTWYYRLKQQDFDGTINYSSAIEANLTVPTKFALYQNYPNPFNSSTVIRYDLAAGEHDVKITIFDLLGQQIKILFNEQQQGGSYQISWDGRDGQGRPVAAGIYFYHLHVGQTTYVKKMVMIE